MCCAGLFFLQELVDRAAVELAATAPVPLQDGKTDVRRESVWTTLRNRMKLGRSVLCNMFIKHCIALYAISASC